VPPSLFTGGRNTPAPGEPLWTEDDVEAVLAYQALHDEICQGCGNPLSESMNPDNDGQYKATRLVCHGCRAREEAARSDQESPNANTAGRRYLALLDNDGG
jgi:hypothetical protein